MIPAASSALSTQSGATNPVSPEAVKKDPAPPASSPRKRAWIGLVLLLVLGAIVHLPALRTPLLLDDYLHASMIDGTFPAKRSPFELYDFINDRDRDALVERGLLPWWSHPELEVRFFRPLSSALRFADHKAFGDKPLLLHLHSFVWWILAVLAARALFRRALGPKASAIATFAFALAPCHALPLAWLANREALVALVFGSAGLFFHARFREENAPKDAALATSLFTLAMLSGEYAMGFFGYVLALELVLRNQTWTKHLLGMAPFAVPAAVYLGVRRSLGYGTFASGFYTDPFRETLPFLRTAPRRIVTLLVDGWFSLDEDTLTPDTPAWALALMALVAAPLVALAMRRAYLALPDVRRRRVGFLMLGSMFALVPVLAVVPSPRVLGVSLLGVTAAVGMLLEHAWFPKEAIDARKPGDGVAELSSFVALALGFSHLVHAPMTAWLVGRRFNASASDFLAHALPMQEQHRAEARRRSRRHPHVGLRVLPAFRAGSARQTQPALADPLADGPRPLPAPRPAHVRPRRAAGQEPLSAHARPALPQRRREARGGRRAALAAHARDDPRGRPERSALGALRARHGSRRARAHVDQRRQLGFFPGERAERGVWKALRSMIGSEGALPLHPTGGSAPRPVRWVAPRGDPKQREGLGGSPPSVRGTRAAVFALPKATQQKGQGALPLVG